MSDVVPVNGGALMSFIERAAKDPGFDVQKFGELLRMQREVVAEQARFEFNTAMATVQNEIERIIPTGKNPSFNNPYAKLEDLDREARPIYSRHGISIRYGSTLSDKTAPPPAPGWQRVVIILSLGRYSEEHHLDGPPTQPSGRTLPIQAVGSSVTYLRRYLLQMALNLVTAQDDDGESTRRAAAAGNRRPPGKTEDDRPTSRNEVVRDEIIAAYDAITARQDYLLLTDKYQTRVEWFRQHQLAMYNTISTAMHKAWARSAPDQAEPAIDADPFAPTDEIEIVGAEKMAAGDD